MKNFCRGLAFCFCPVGRLYETGLSAAEAGCRTLFFHVKRECGFVVPPWAAKDIDNTNSGLRQRGYSLATISCHSG